MTPTYWNDAQTHLAKACPTLGELIATYEGESLMTRGDAFYTLARSIAGQQISVKAADAVWNRVAVLVKPMTPKTMLKYTDEELRACGLSGSKVKYMRHLAEFFITEKIKPGFWDDLSDEEVIKHITQIKGIGVWTAEMFMIFHLQRPNVFPLADIGLQKAILRHYPKVKAPTPENLLKISKKWHPYRSVATWYLWRALDPVPVEY